MSQPIRKTITGELDVHVYDWVSLFQLLGFKHILNILKYYVFRVGTSQSTVVFLKEYSTTTEVSHTVMETTVVSHAELPVGIVPKGLSLER